MYDTGMIIYDSVLDKIVTKQLPFTFNEGDIIVFACRTIPVPMNIANREQLESTLKANKVRIFTNVHSSGHASKEDIRDLINITKPKHLIPSQGEPAMETSVAKMAETENYVMGKTLHLLSDGQRIRLD